MYMFEPTQKQKVPFLNSCGWGQYLNHELPKHSVLQSVHVCVNFIGSCKFPFSFLRTGRPQTETAGSTDSSQQVNIEASSLASESRESTAFQHSLDTTDTQLTPDSFQFTHSPTETPYSGEYSSSEAESGERSPQSTTSTTPLTLRESNVCKLSVYYYTALITADIVK